MHLPFPRAMTALPAGVTSAPAPPAPVKRQQFTKKELALFWRVAKTQSTSGDTAAMERLITRIAWEAMADQVWSDQGNVYVVKGAPPAGTPYPAIVAHTDTIFPIIPRKHYLVRRLSRGTTFHWEAVDRSTERTDEAGQRWVTYCGLGGDDKCGIWLALNALRTFPYLKCAFFRDEETGCEGSHDADLDFFADCAFVLQGDRRGNGDFVDRIGGDLSSPEFLAAVRPLLAKHGFRPSWGASTDVGALKRDGLPISAANMSAGYHNYHSRDEYVVEADLIGAQSLMHDIIIQLGDRVWPHEAPPFTTYQTWSRTDEWGGSGYYHDQWGEGSEWDKQNLRAIGFVQDGQGLWSLPDEIAATIEAKIALFPHWAAGEPCPYCGFAYPTWSDGIYLCKSSTWRIAQHQATEHDGCGAVLPITRQQLDDRTATAERINKAITRRLERDAARHAHNLAPLREQGAAIDGQTRDAGAMRSRPACCWNCEAPGHKAVWSARDLVWCCVVCLAYDTDGPDTYRLRRARAIVGQLQGFDDLPHELGQPRWRGALIEMVATWLAEGEEEDVIADAIAEMVADQRSDGAHDRHDGSPYRNGEADPGRCTICGDEPLSYDDVEESWYCLNRDSYIAEGAGAVVGSWSAVDEPNGDSCTRIPEIRRGPHWTDQADRASPTTSR